MTRESSEWTSCGKPNQSGTVNKVWLTTAPPVMVFLTPEASENNSLFIQGRDCCELLHGKEKFKTLKVLRLLSISRTQTTLISRTLRISVGSFWSRVANLEFTISFYERVTLSSVTAITSSNFRTFNGTIDANIEMWVTFRYLRIQRCFVLSEGHVNAFLMVSAQVRYTCPFKIECKLCNLWWALGCGFCYSINAMFWMIPLRLRFNKKATTTRSLVIVRSKMKKLCLQVVRNCNFKYLHL